jgi:CheY-like chemotaxis protein
MQVLYAEDDIDDFALFCEIVKQINDSVQCINTANGRETLEFLENAATLPDLIFLDINMPIMDGKSCLKRIKGNRRFSNIPVVMYTTSRNEKDEQQCRDWGAMDYLKKPAHIHELVDQLSPFFEEN